jgi:hypothetical protein
VGARCNVSIQFAPAVPAGQAVTDTFALIDNNLNASPSATQTVNINATAIPPQPSVTAVSPATGPSAGGTVVTVTGVNLTGTSAVKFGTVSATNVSVAGPTQVSATSPAGTGGSTVDVTVISYGATSVTSGADQFVYQLTPDIITVSGTVPSSVAYNSGTVAIGATSTSGQPVTYASTYLAVCSVDASGVVTTLSTGNCIVNVSQDAAGTYAAATTVSVHISVTAGTDTITVPGTVPTSAVYASGTISIGATSTSAQPVTYTSTTSGICSVTTPGGVVTLLNIGTCTVNVSQAAAGNFAAATTVPVNINVTVAPDTITVPGTVPLTAAYGSGTISIGATSTSTQPVTYTSTTTSVCSVTTPGGVVALLSVGTCTVNVSQGAAGNYAAATTVPVSISITAGADTITVPGAVPSSVVYGSGTVSLGATSTSAQPVTYTSTTTGVCTVTTPGGVVTMLNIGTCTVNVSQAAAGNYAAATNVPVSIVVTVATDTISFPVLGTAVYGATPPAPAATSTSLQPVTYGSSTSSVCTATSSGVITILSIGTCTITANQAAAGNYASATQLSKALRSRLQQMSSLCPELCRLP